MLTRKYTHTKRVKRDPLDLPRPARIIRMYYDGSMVTSDWYYVNNKAVMYLHTMDEYENDYPYLFVAGKDRVLVAPAELGFFRRLRVSTVTRVMQQTYEDVSGEITDKLEYANAVLVRMTLFEQNRIGDKWYNKKVKQRKKFSYNKAKVKIYGKLV